MHVVTGGAGFIGSNLVAALEARGAGPIAVCDPMDGPKGDRADHQKEQNLVKHRIAHRVEPNDLIEFLRDHAGDVESVFHMGAISSTTETEFDLYERNNVVFSTDIWTWCAEAGVPLIYASSAATYGDGSRGFDDDGSIAALKALHPLNLYGRSKNKFDIQVAEAIAAGRPRPPQWAGLKFFNVYGPNEYHKDGQTSVVYQIFPRARSDQPARLFKSHNPDYTDGGQLRDFIWVGDCVAVMLWLFDHPAVSGLFNCGTGQARSFKDLASAVYRALGKEPLIDYVPTPENIRDKYQYFTQARMERLRAAGFDRPFTTLEDGVATYVRDYLSAADPYR